MTIRKIGESEDIFYGLGISNDFRPCGRTSNCGYGYGNLAPSVLQSVRTQLDMRAAFLLGTEGAAKTVLLLWLAVHLKDKASHFGVQ